jgi:hypothetical protein
LVAHSLSRAPQNLNLLDEPIGKSVSFDIEILGKLEI